jgi:hypothetical protein
MAWVFSSDRGPKEGRLLYGKGELLRRIADALDKGGRVTIDPVGGPTVSGDNLSFAAMLYTGRGDADLSFQRAAENERKREATRRRGEEAGDELIAMCGVRKKKAAAPAQAAAELSFDYVDDERRRGEEAGDELIAACGVRKRKE